MILQSGTTLHGGKYHVVRMLGQGSFGITYLATEGSMQVAIKEFFMRDVNGRSGTEVTSGNSEGGLFAKYKQDFIKEARNLSRCQHPHIVNVFDTFEENNTAYYVMEYIDGGSLNDYIESKNALDCVETKRIAKQIGDALTFMHSNNMVHLDLKPSNIMLRKTGVVVLIDFGLSKQFDSDGIPESSTTIGGGTPGYAPLEQASHKSDGGLPVTMDVYAFGATMYKMLTGKRPPEASDILNNGFPFYDLRWHNVDEALSENISTAMSVKKSERFQSVSDFVDSWYEEDEEETEVVEDVDYYKVAAKSIFKRLNMIQYLVAIFQILIGVVILVLGQMEVWFVQSVLIGGILSVFIYRYRYDSDYSALEKMFVDNKADALTAYGYFLAALEMLIYAVGSCLVAWILGVLFDYIKNVNG